MITKQRRYSVSSISFLVISLCGTQAAGAITPPTPTLAAFPTQDETVIDSVVATIDEKQTITLRDVEKRLGRSQPLSQKAATQDSQVRAALDTMVQEALVREEATRKKLSTTPPEIEEYISAVAERNGLTRDKFEEALIQEGKKLTDYRNQVEIEILKSKLVSSYAKGGVSVTDAEIEAYLESHPELHVEGTQLKLRQILFKTESRTVDEAKAALEKIRDEVKDGASFATLAEERSEGPEAKDGGLIGLVNEKDLSGDVSEAVLALKEKEVSEPVTTPSGVHLFYVEQRFGANDDDDDDEVLRKTRGEVRRILQEQKGEAKAGSYFSTELSKYHSVDIKL